MNLQAGIAPSAALGTFGRVSLVADRRNGRGYAGAFRALLKPSYDK